MQTLRVDVWSDIACPWCYVGKRRLERAIERSPARAALEVVWRAFELDPAAPREVPSGSYAQRLAKKYGTSVEEAANRIDRMTEMARLDGLRFDFDHIRPGNTFDAHRLLHWARRVGLQDQAKERFFRGYFCEGAAISDPGTLIRLSTEVGLDEQETAKVLASNAYAEEVRADETEARELGIHGVPFFVLAGHVAVSGAQPSEALLDALELAQRHLGTLSSEGAEGRSCGLDGC